MNARFTTRALALLALLALLGLLVAGCRGTRERSLLLATTTSVVDSGLLEPLLETYRETSGHTVEVRAVGSGRALEMLATGEADVALTHAPLEEQAAVASGAAGRRVPIMVNDFVLVGPLEHASVVAGAVDAREAMRRIAGSGRKFVSRGDDSGTHRKERALWGAAGVSAGDFVVSAKAGMADCLARAAKDEAFALTDRATFLAHRAQLDLVIVLSGDASLRNIYSVIEPKVGSPKAEAARAFVDWLRSPAGRAQIGAYGLRELGEPLFIPAE